MSRTRLTEPSHHLARYARSRHTDTRPDGTIVVTFAAFMWTKAGLDDQGLSVNWLDHFPGDKNAQLTAIRSSMHMTPGAKDRLALMQIGQLESSLQASAGLTIGVLHDPVDPTDRYAYPNPSHAMISGLPDAGSDATRAQDAATFIAKDCVIEHVPARTPSG